MLVLIRFNESAGYFSTYPYCACQHCIMHDDGSEPWRPIGILRSIEAQHIDPPNIAYDACRRRAPRRFPITTVAMVMRNRSVGQTSSDYTKSKRERHAA
jgi:hypothetical protein